MLPVGYCLVIAGLEAIVLAIAIGANDTANSFGTSVGAQVLTLLQVYILGSVCETLGALLMGHKVTGTMRRGVIDVDLINDPDILIIGQIAVLSSCMLWMVLATVFKKPVSTTHSIVGGTIGFGLCVGGFGIVHWSKIIEIAISWLLSPALAGVFAVGTFVLMDHGILRQAVPFETGLTVQPALYMVAISMNVFAAVYGGSSLLGFDQLTLGQCLAISAGMGVVVAVAVFLLRSWIMRRIELSVEKKRKDAIESGAIVAQELISRSSTQVTTATSCNTVDEVGEKSTMLSIPNRIEIPETPEPPTVLDCVHNCLKRFFRNRSMEDPYASTLFAYLQVMSACFSAVGHGGNDVSNAVAPLVTLVHIYNGEDADHAETPMKILAVGAVGMCFGLWLFGKRVINTVANEISHITPARGFAIEFGSAMTVLLASHAGLPVSSTQCKIGAIMFLGMVEEPSSVQYDTLSRIAATWVMTLPVTLGISYFTTFAAIHFILPLFAGAV